ncbi:DMT family transporter [Mesorhizobium sp. J428]|uniref:DMT family transporter n=1 Tax=Mesorhizobium sp. J428 TaxID=2898440 RepID=UPI002151CC09|nr:DMT family transporter [Mesorhizobium sp. J428]MCR5858941.1 DMT family transporter [Mesorhizobium sp. J428]
MPHFTFSRPVAAIILKTSSIAVFVGMQSFIKLAGVVPAGQIVFFRSFFALIPILILLAWTGELRTAFYTSRPGRHVVRGLVGVSSMALGFFALTRLPLPEAIMLNYAQPLLVVVISALVLGEVVRVFRWTAVAVGFLGVLIISWPKLTLFTSPDGMGSAEAVGVAAALVAAAISAVALLQVRSLVQTEKSSTVVIWFSLTASAAGLFTLPFGWAPLTGWQFFYLVMSGICGGVAQVLMTESYRHASVATVAPFEYTSILFGLAAGYLLFGDLPTVHSIVGGAIVVGSGLMIIWREQRLGLERGKARKVMPPQ